jgi:hypothetical protein
MTEDIIDAESSTLNKNAGPLDHLRHLINIGWDGASPMITKFVEKHKLQDELISLLEDRKRQVK